VNDVQALAPSLATLFIAAGFSLVGVHVGCSNNPCCGGGENPGFVINPPSPSLVVLDVVSGAPLCTASGVVQCNQPLPSSGLCTVTCTDDAPSPCDQSQAGTYTMTATVTAPGYSTGKVTFPVFIGACGLTPGGDGGVSATVHLHADCATTVTHENGVGQQWTDCTAPYTYSQAEATAACEVSSANDGYDCPQLVSCRNDAGATGQVAVCSSTIDSRSVQACDCWTFEGPGAGHVHVSDAGCSCASASDPSWE
jgi:hypothetical protein